MADLNSSTGRPVVAGAVAGGFARMAVLVAALTLAARIVGFGRWLVFSKTIGDTCLGDAYNAANQLPNVLFEVVAGGLLAGVVVPVIGRHVSQGRTEQASASTSALISWTLAALTPVAVGAFFAAHAYGRAFVAPTCTGGAEVAAALLVIFVPQIWLYGLAVIAAGVLQANNRFLAAAAAPLLSSLVVVGAYLFFGYLATRSSGPVSGSRIPMPGSGSHSLTGQDLTGLSDRLIAVLGWGTTAGVLVLALTTLIPLSRMGMKLRPRFRFAAGDRGIIVRIGIASALGLAMQQVALLLITWLAKSTNDPGAITRFVWANALYLLPFAVVVSPLLQMVFPRLTAAAGAGRQPVITVLREFGGPVMVLSGLGAAVLAASAVPVARFFVLGPGSGRTGALSAPILAMAPAVVGFGLMGLVTRTLLAQHLARAAAATTLIAWVIVAVVATLARLVLPTESVVTGLGAAVSIGMLAGAVTGWWLVHRGLRQPTLGWSRTAAVSMMAATVAGGAVNWVSRPMANSSLGVAIGGGFACAVGSLVLYGLLVAVADRPALSQLQALTHHRMDSTKPALADDSGPEQEGTS